MRKPLAIILIVCFLFGNNVPPAYCEQGVDLPKPGAMVGPSPAYAPVVLKGMVIHPHEPLKFDFIIEAGDSKLRAQDPFLREESDRLIKYFLTALTIPESDLWVNLSPYEKDRIIPEALGQTLLGRDLLKQDYILKQLTATLIYPEKQLGREFWRRVYALARSTFGTTQIPVNTYNKVWILPDKAEVFERNNAVYITRAHLKVMLDEDFTARAKHNQTKASAFSSQVVRQIILPEIEKEVNGGKNFTAVRQIYYSLILAKWYKESIKQSLLAKVYEDKNKIKGINLQDTGLKERIYAQYLIAYKKGVFNYIKDEQGDLAPHKYFSGGFKMATRIDHTSVEPAGLETPAMVANVDLIGFNAAMIIDKPATKEKLIAMLSQMQETQELRGIRVVTDDPDTHQALSELGLEQTPNQKTLQQKFFNLLTSKDKVISLRPRKGLRQYRIGLKEPLVNGTSEVLVLLKVDRDEKEMVDHLIELKKQKAYGQVDIILPRSLWHLPKENVSAFAKAAGVPEASVNYSGRAHDVELAQQAESLRQQNALEMARVEELRRQKKLDETRFAQANLDERAAALKERMAREAAAKAARLADIKEDPRITSLRRMFDKVVREQNSKSPPDEFTEGFNDDVWSRLMARMHKALEAGEKVPTTEEQQFKAVINEFTLYFAGIKSKEKAEAAHRPQYKHQGPIWAYLRAHPNTIFILMVSMVALNLLQMRMYKGLGAAVQKNHTTNSVPVQLKYLTNSPSLNTNKAMAVNGGIDMKNINLSGSRPGALYAFDPTQNGETYKDGVEGFLPIIVRITVFKNPARLFSKL